MPIVNTLCENKSSIWRYCAALQIIEKTGATRRSRTGDLLITNQLLYRLS
jgi:hypothetical protein